MSQQVSPMWYRGNHCSTNNQNVSIPRVCEVAGRMEWIWSPVHHPPNSGNIPQKYNRSPMVESEGETGSGEDTASSIKSSSLSVRSLLVYPQCNGDVEAIEHSSSKKATPAVHPSLCKNLTGKFRWNSGRARPSHPVFYKTSRKVKLRSGRGSLTKNLGYLPRDSIVVINQIKGRSGRVAFRDKFGRYRTAGWVTLYAKKNQFLRRYNPHTKDRELALSSFANVMVE